MIKGIFDSTVDALHGSLDLRAERHKLLVSNIANIETPGYKARDIRFEEEMKRAAAAGSNQSPLVTTAPRHIKVSSLGTGGPAPVDRASDLEGYDKNSVGVDSEMVKLSENTLMYNTSAKLLREKFLLISTAIREGGR